MKLYSEETMKAVRSAFEHKVLGWPDVGPNKRFGCPCYEAKGKLFAFLVTRGVVVTQLPEADRDRLAREGTASSFAPGGRTIRSWMTLPISVEGELARILPIVRSSYRAALGATKKT